LSSEKASVSIKKSCFEMLRKNWTEDEGALTPTFFIFYNTERLQCTLLPPHYCPENGGKFIWLNSICF